MFLTVYTLPAVVALLAKGGMFFYARYSKVHNVQTRLYLLFLFSLSIQNLAEVSVFITNTEGDRNLLRLFGTLYFSASILAIALLAHLALTMAAIRCSRRILVGLYLPAVVLEGLLLFPPLLIAGFEPMNYTITRVPGPLYFLFEFYAIGYVCAAAGSFLHGACKHTNRFHRLQNRFLLLGLIPIVAIVVTVISLEHLGFREFNTTATLPFGITFFLAVTAYATHQHRLFDIEFFIPWSKVRKRKTAFYRRIQTLISEIAQMTSARSVVASLSETLCCPIALLVGPRPTLTLAGEAFALARFPLIELKKIDHIVVANEIAYVMPAIHALMRRHRVAAIVPFHPHSATAASWMLLGETFSDHVYSPLDFREIEDLFARLADRFLDSQILLRSQLREAQQEIDTLHQRLANAWQQIEELRTKLTKTEDENSCLWKQNTNLCHRDLVAIQQEILEFDDREQKSFDEHIAEFEARLLAITLEYCRDDVSRAAELLEMPLTMFYHKLKQYRLRELRELEDPA